MKRIIACIVACISLFFGVACKDKREKVEYEEGHVLLTDDFFGFEEGELEKELVTRGFKIVDKSKVSKEEYRYYADSFEMGFEKIFTYQEGNMQGFFCAEYRDEETAKYYEKKFNGKETKCFRYRNILIYEMFPMYFVLGLTGAYEEVDGCWYMLTKDKKRLLDYYNEDVTSIPTFQIPNGVEYVVGLSLAYSPAEKVICSDTVIEILLLAANYNSIIHTIVLNDGLKKIGTNAFYGCENFEYTVIPLSVEKIGEQAFSHGNIFCEAEAKPNGWADDFYCEQAKVYWKGEWAYDENGKPVPLVQEEPPQEDGVAT